MKPETTSQSATLAPSKPGAKSCDACHKPLNLCVCDQINVFTPRTRVLILQHPQEPDKELGSAILVHRSLNNSVLRVGLSWRNLRTALGEDADPKKWGVLFLGTQRGSKETSPQGNEFRLVGRGGALNATQLEGVIVLDGNWRQAKALWWRNPWLLKLNRIVLNPKNPSLYGTLRQEPRRESISTLESVALVLAHTEQDDKIQNGLLELFKTFLLKVAATRSRIPRSTAQPRR